MSTVTRQIAAVEFQADARQANQAIESMRLEADKCNKKIELLQDRLSKGIKTIKIEGRDTDVEKEIKNQQRLARSYNDAAAALMKGVKAWDELWKHAKTGDIEALTGQQIKAGINGAKRQYDRLILGDEEDRRKALAIKDIVDQANIVLDKLKGSTNEVIQTLNDGGHVADEVLQREKKYLEDMLGLTEKFSPEWQDYNRQLQDVNKYIEQQAAEEKRLRGELVDANDARREAEKLDQQRADAAKKEHEAQQKVIDDAKMVLQQREDELRLHKESAQKKSEEIARQDQLINKQNEVVESVKRENREINKKSGSLNKAAREADNLADRAKRAADKSAGEVNKLALKLADAEGKVRDLQVQLDKLNETGTQSASVDKERQWLTEKLNKAKQEQADIETKLNEKTQKAKRLSDESVKANENAAAKRDELNKAQADGNKRLQEESQKLSDLQAKRNEDVNALNKEKEAIKQTTAAANEQGKIIHDAQQKQAQNRQLSIDSIEKAIELLKQENRVVGDETNPQWVENEKTIGRLNQRLSEMKQHAAELRGEAMSLGKALEMANTNNAHPYSIDEMQKGLKVLQEQQNVAVDPSKYTEAIDVLAQKLREAKGEAVSLENALEMADANNGRQFSIEQMQQGLSSLQSAQLSSTDPNKYTEAIANLTQKIREAKGEAVSLDDALNFGKQGLDGSFKGTTEQLRQAKQVLEQTLDHTAKGQDKYNEIREALAGIAIEEKRVGGVTKEMQAVLDQPKGRSFNELKMAVEQGRKALNDMGRATKEEQQAYDKLAEKVKAADLELKNVGNTSKGTTSAFEKAVSRLKTYITLYMGTAVAIQKLTATMGDVMTLSDKMGEVRKTTGFTAEQVGKLSDNLAKLDTRTPIQNLMDLAAVGGQLGLKTEEDVQGFAEAANKMLVALPEMGQDGAEQMMKIAIATKEVDKIRKQMEEGTVSGSSATAVAMEKIASTIDRLRATTAAAAPPIADFVKRVGAVGAQSGISVDQVAALGATVDSLGMGTEMAATAISRMIPAIKNHAFDIAQAIGVTPKTIRDLYDSGKAMDVILMILQHIHDQNLNPDGIEKLLGTGGMGEIMKELDQQGARAGIVFAGLSQNVDELRTNLNTAKEAYRDNTAVQQEYDKMNDTTAAKLERLKNQISEVFVTAKNAKMFGVLIDIMRALVSFITGNVNPALRVLSYIVKSLFVYWGILKIGLGEAIFVKAVDGARNMASQLRNLLSNTQAYIRYSALLSRAHDEEARAAIKARMANEGLSKAMLANVWTAAAAAAFYLVGTAIGKMRDKVEQAREEAEKLDAEEERVQAEQDQLGVSAKAVSDAYDNTLKQTLSDLQGKYAQLKSKWEELKTEQQKIQWIKDNQKAFKDLGLNVHSVKEAEDVFNNNTDYVVDAFERRAKAAAYAAKLTALYKRQIDLLDKKRENAKSIAHDAAYSGRSAKAGQEITDPTFHSSQYGYVNSGGKWVFSKQGAALYSGKSTKGNPQGDKIDSDLASVDADIKQTNEDLRSIDVAVKPGSSSGNGGGGGTSGTGGGTGGGTDKNNPWGTNADAASTNWSKLTGKQLVERRKQMNDFVKSLQWDTDVSSVLSEDPALHKAMKEGKVKKDTDSVIAWYNKQRLAIQSELHSRFLTNTGNWQDPKKAHQHAKSASKMVKDEMSYYLDELDAFYTEQKSKIEEAQNEGMITEAEGQRRILENDRVWQQQRGELQQVYAGKREKVAKQEQDAIFNILSERTGDSTGMIEANINNTLDFIKKVGDKSMPAMRRILGDLDLGMEQSFLKMRTAVKKQVEAITAIIDKERPFNGIVRNLETNISTMGLLKPDLEKKIEALKNAGKGDTEEARKLNEQYQSQTPKRLTFLLQESESAYQMTWEKLEADMRKNGFGDWANAILNSDNADRDKQAIIAQLHNVYDDVQDAIKKEASEVKKQVDIMWNNTSLLPNGASIKQTYERAANALGVEQGRVSRANSMIGAGTASERVADKLAIKQMEIQLQMQTHYYNIMRKIGEQRVTNLELQAAEARAQGDINKSTQLMLDAKHAKMSLDLTLSEEETDLAKQREEINARVEESEAKLYNSLKEWSTLFSSSLQGLFEASNTGAADYYNNLAKMHLTGEGSGGGTYVVIDNAGTEKAEAHYETLDGEDALKRQLEIEQQNAVADEWKKVMDDINKKISDQITDWMNAALQNQAMDANTDAVVNNTQALYDVTDALLGGTINGGNMGVGDDGISNALRSAENLEELPRAQRKRMGLKTQTESDADNSSTPLWQKANTWGDQSYTGGEEHSPVPSFADAGYTTPWASYAEASTKATQKIVQNNKKQLQSTTDTHKKEKDSAKNTYSAMAAAMNMYGLAYQVMSNDNMSSTQKFLTFALQSAGQVAIAMLTTNMLQTDAQSKIELPGILGKAASHLGPVAGPIAFAAMTALLGGLMAVAMSKTSKAKSQISQVTGASVSAGRLSTGMLTYAEGNVNEFTDPSTLTPGQQYNVDAADGHTYRARYMGSNPTTHLTNGPEFHLVGERGREAIIDANTTRQLQMNDTGIWNAIQTLYNGGSIRSVRRSGMRNFATGNLDDFADATGAGMTGAADGTATETTDVVSSLQASLDRNSDVLERALRDGFKGVFDIHGKGGLVDSYDRGKKEANRHGEKY